MVARVSLGVVVLLLAVVMLVDAELGRVSERPCGLGWMHPELECRP